MVDGYFCQRLYEVRAGAEAGRGRRAMMAEKVDCWTTVWSKRAGLVIFGWMLCAAYHHTEYAAKAERAVPALEAQAGCEEWRANKNGNLALAPIVISKDQLAKDACPHPKVDPAERPVAK
jgi:hypothetical protein